MQNEDVTLALYEISNAVNTTSDLDELYKKIHQSLGRIIDTKNFYIAISLPSISNLITSGASSQAELGD